MALNTLKSMKCNHLTPLDLKGLTKCFQTSTIYTIFRIKCSNTIQHRSSSKINKHETTTRTNSKNHKNIGWMPRLLTQHQYLLLSMTGRCEMRGVGCGEMSICKMWGRCGDWPRNLPAWTHRGHM